MKRDHQILFAAPAQLTFPPLFQRSENLLAAKCIQDTKEGIGNWAEMTYRKEDHSISRANKNSLGKGEPEMTIIFKLYTH